MSGTDRASQEREWADSRGNPEFFLYLMTPVQGRLYAYILSRWPNKSDADDIMQETISILWQKFETYEPGSEFSAWAFKVAKFVLSNFRKKHYKNQIQFSEEALSALENQSDNFLKNYTSQIETLRDCLKKLPSKESKILTLKYEEGVSSKKIATRFGMSIRTFYRVISKIHTGLMRCMRLKTMGANQ